MKTTKKFTGKENNQNGKVKGLIETLVVIGLILLIPLFFAIRTAANSQPAPNTPAPAAPTTAAQNIPPTSTITPQQPPACTFPLAQTTAVESTSEEYTFSEPQIVLTDPDNHYNIVEWLPDNQQVLITEDLYSTREMESDKFLRQSIELYNPETGESKVYAIRHYIEEPPSWQPGLNAVVYPAMNFMGIDENTHLLKFTRQVWVSHGNPKAAQMLADNLPQFPLAVKPGGSEVVYLSDKKISKRNNSLKDIPSAPFDLTEWDYAKGRRNELPISYEMAWQPGTPLIFLYSNGGGLRMGGYTFVLDADTGRLCELNLDGWAFKADWSPDGRYLAIGRAREFSFPVNLTDLTVLDTATGNLYITGITPQEVEGKHYVDDFVWAPDNRHLLAIGSVTPFQNSSQVGIDGLYLVDFISGQSDHLLPEYKFYASPSDNNLAWSPDGSKVVIRCPTYEEDRVCFISVQRSGQ
ncbi:MAG: hypothetical protein HZB19_02160 [Chloroflexi bacterium]|nr:hypothetical protein [Chloroflexota bacterium]